MNSQSAFSDPVTGLAVTDVGGASTQQKLGPAKTSSDELGEMHTNGGRYSITISVFICPSPVLGTVVQMHR